MTTTGYNQLSTDNWQSDAMQIAAEQYETQEEDGYGDEDQGGFNDGHYDEPIAYHTFECSVYNGPGSWYDWKRCYVSENLEQLTKAMQAKHDEVCDCGQDIIVN